jgi:hypothetical protein
MDSVRGVPISKQNVIKHNQNKVLQLFTSNLGII